MPRNGTPASRLTGREAFPETAAGAARKSYLTALYRAEAQRSIDGVLHAAEGFAALGDTGAVQNCVVMAGRLADGDAEAQARVMAFDTPGGRSYTDAPWRRHVSSD